MIQAQRLGPVLVPRPQHAKFNAGMVRDGDIVHMLYRWAEAPRKDDKGFPLYTQDFVSYARLDIEGRLLEDRDDRPFLSLPPNAQGKPVYTQDPRIVPFEGEFLLFYSVWDLSACRVGIARTKDFRTVEPIGVVPNGNWDKDAFIFPERFDGKIAYMHRVEPDIQIDYFESFEELVDEASWQNYAAVKHERVVLKGEQPWENQKVGGGVPPIRTELGWLLLYHGVADDRVPFCYRAGAAILDAAHPSKVLYRLPYPILEPTEEYEHRGDVPEVVFPQGAYRRDNWLYVSYGGADKVVGLCRFDYNELLDELKNYPVSAS